ncbi:MULTISPECIES: hypothetical protein [unclassified Streptomyces]|uniref:hypothetical protein n=1 Tax=unclassified Streptomyces TaxID=2593676 RepID=UPI002DD8F75A|nr:hypothetical protein [Streptomyces sp. NBC_01768]WSC32358.1 hypothetical protein OG902_39875 [Streptomyces sp. NBC_01768]WSX06408.1 hypothetical protein OG355_41540 [Streptomyces sp. NBC_00987]
MSREQHEEQQTRYGSHFARMFGYVTAEDRSRWEQTRAQNQKHINAAVEATKSSLGSMLDFGERIVGAKLDAAHRVAAQQGFEESHDKIVSEHRDPRTRSITETVDYEPKDDREEIEPDLEL